MILLRVLQDHEIRPVGAGEDRLVDVRVVAATNRRVGELLSSDVLRRDLLYRLSVINIELPPLRERSEDIPLLIDHFLGRLNARLGRQVAVTPETVAWLSSLDWPGNVRELENALERAITLHVGVRLVPEDFAQFAFAPKSGRAESRERATYSVAASDSTWLCELPLTLDEVERKHIVATLRYTNGNKLRAADLLGIGRYSLYRKSQKAGYQSGRFRVPVRGARGASAWLKVFNLVS